MRIGVAWEAKTSASNYRAIQPALAMVRRGHDPVSHPDGEGALDLELFLTCDVVHVYRRYDAETRQAAARLVDAGVPITWDNDDDYLLVPEEHPFADQYTGEAGRERFRDTVAMASLARVVTTTTEPVAARYREAGVERIEVIPNQLRPGALRPPQPHEGIVVGWIAGLEHRADANRVPIADALERLVARHDDVRVECIGVDLELPERYFHDDVVPFDHLPDRIAGFDIGIAPLADIPFNRARSDIKVKEYAACGVPWLASPVGPYQDLGEAEGGRLVDDDDWLPALERLVRKRRERRRLGAAAAAWAKAQTIEATARRWEQVFLEAATGARPAAGVLATMQGD